MGCPLPVPVKEQTLRVAENCQNNVTSRKITLSLETYRKRVMYFLYLDPAQTPCPSCAEPITDELAMPKVRQKSGV